MLARKGGVARPGTFSWWFGDHLVKQDTNPSFPPIHRTYPTDSTMKIKTLSRSEEAFTRECKGDVVKVFRNLEPALHPFDKAREYTRALTATKLDKMFAKPLVGTCCWDVWCGVCAL
jgi:hypothetical protein